MTKKDVSDSDYEDISDGINNAKEMPPEGIKKTISMGGDCPVITKWIIENIIAENTCTVIGAEEKTGKSWMVYMMAICIANGKPLFGYPTIKTGKTIIYSPESNMDRKKERFWGLCWGLCLDPRVALENVLFLQGGINMLDEKDRDELARTLEYHKPRLFIIDPLITAHRGADENSAKDFQPVLDAIRNLNIANQGMSIVVTHHLGKDNRSRTLSHGLRGSTALSAWYDTLITLRKSDDTGNSTRRMDVLHRDALSPQTMGYELAVGPGHEGGLSTFWLNAVEVREIGKNGHKSGPKLDEDLLEVVFGYVSAATGNKTRGSIADDNGMNRKKFNIYFKHLEEQGRVKVGPGGIVEIITN